MSERMYVNLDYLEGARLIALNRILQTVGSMTSTEYFLSGGARLAPDQVLLVRDHW